MSLGELRHDIVLRQLAIELAEALMVSGKSVHIEIVQNADLSIDIIPDKKVVRVVVELLEEDETEHDYITYAGAFA